MNLNDAQRIELNELCSLLADGALDDAGRGRLDALLRDSEEARVFYVRAMQLSASLYDYSLASQADAPDRIVRPSFWQKPSRWIWPAAAAAGVALGAWLNFSKAPGGDADSVARITGGKDSLWVGAALHAGDELMQGQRVELRSGFAEITFDSGAQLVLEGPASLDVRSAWEAGLNRGTVKANVPTEAIGFRVASAAVEVVDLGTEFSLTTDEQGESEVFVLKGAVEVQPKQSGKPGARSVLGEKQARRFAKAGAEEVRDRDAKFRKLASKVPMERILKPAMLTRWSFDEDGGLRLSGTTTTNGRWGKALGFSAESSGHATVPPATRKSARTAAFWLRVPPSNSDAATTSRGSIMSLPVGARTTTQLGFSLNQHPGHGALNALRLDLDGGGATGSQVLNDGRWHHVAVVFNPAQKNPAKDKVAIYINGRLDAQSFKRARQNAAAAAPAELVLSGDGFVGELDEVVLADRALSQMEIRHLMKSNALPSPDSLAAGF